MYKQIVEYVNGDIEIETPANEPLIFMISRLKIRARMDLNIERIVLLNSQTGKVVSKWPDDKQEYSANK